MDVWECEYLLPLFMLTLCAAPVARHPVRGTRCSEASVFSVVQYLYSFALIFSYIPNYRNCITLANERVLINPDHKVAGEMSVANNRQI